MQKSYAGIRTLKIEAVGDFAGNKVKPRIRLTGLSTGASGGNLIIQTR
jgi:hypothetical protein